MLKILTRQALHAKTIGFIHPGTKQQLSFDSDIPLDMQECLAGLEGKARQVD